MWTRIDKDDPGTWPQEHRPTVNQSTAGDGEWFGEVAGGLRTYVEDAPSEFHGIAWAYQPNPHDTPADDGLVEVRIAVTVDEDGMGWHASVLYEGNDHDDTRLTLEWLVRNTGPETPCHAVVVTARVPKYTPPPVVEFVGVIDAD